MVPRRFHACVGGVGRSPRLYELQARQRQLGLRCRTDLHREVLQIEGDWGDWIVNGEETSRDKDIQLSGSLILPAGIKLTLEDCSLEIIGDYSRQHSLEFKGGSASGRHHSVWPGGCHGAWKGATRCPGWKNSIATAIESN